MKKLTGLWDRHGAEISVGDTVKDADGRLGKVVFANGAYRYDVQDGVFLKYNSSLLYKERVGSAKFEIVRKAGCSTNHKRD